MRSVLFTERQILEKLDDPDELKNEAEKLQYGPAIIEMMGKRKKQSLLSQKVTMT